MGNGKALEKKLQHTHPLQNLLLCTCVPASLAGVSRLSRPLGICVALNITGCGILVVYLVKWPYFLTLFFPSSMQKIKSDSPISGRLFGMVCGCAFRHYLQPVITGRNVLWSHLLFVLRSNTQNPEHLSFSQVLQIRPCSLLKHFPQDSFSRWWKTYILLMLSNSIRNRGFAI